MNYTEITDLALNYGDRQDTEVVDRIDDFLRMVEARINRSLDVQKMAIRTVLTTQLDQEYYGLPSDFTGLRDIEISSEDNSLERQSLTYLNPEQMNAYVTNTGSTEDAKIFYTIIANQLHIYPAQDTKLMEIVYYRKIPELGMVNTENWVSTDYPDLYLNGLMVEINSFVKDAEAAALWDARYKQAIQEITFDDKDSRWSGTSLRMRAEL